jgi:hypothetical protein
VQTITDEMSEAEPTPEEDKAREQRELEEKLAKRRAESVPAPTTQVAAPASRAVIERVKKRKIVKPPAPTNRAGTVQTETAAKAALAEEVRAENADVLTPEVTSQPDTVALVPDLPSAAELKIRNPRRNIESLKAGLAKMQEAKEQAEIREVAGETHPPVGTTLGKIVGLKEFFPEKSAVHTMVTGNLMRRVRSLVPDTPVEILDYPSMVRLHIDQVRRGKMAPGDMPYGLYDTKENRIYYLSDALADPEWGPHVVMHEAAHAAYEHALRNNGTVEAHIKGLMQTVKDYFQENNQPIPDELQYGLQSPSEFLAEAMSRPAFQQWLMDIPSTRENRHISGFYRSPFGEKLRRLWHDFIEGLAYVIGKNHGVEFSVLEEIVKAQQQLDIDVTNDLPTHLAAASGGGPDAVPFIPTRIKEEISDRSGGLKFRRLGLIARTLDQIRQSFPGIFPHKNGDPIERIQKEMQAAENEAVKHGLEGLGMAHRFSLIEKADHKEGAKVADLLIRATSNNVNFGPGANNSHLKEVSHAQALAELPGIEAAYAALKPESQKFVREAGEYFRDMENQIRRESLKQILQNKKPELTEKQHNALIEASMNGVMDEDHKTILQDEALYKGLRDQGELRRIKGYYFPLQRHGDFVVTTTDKLGDVGTGVIAEQDKRTAIVEWTGDTEDAAKQDYLKFARATDLKITSVGKKKLPDGKIMFRARVQKQGVYFFDSEREARRFIRENRKDFDSTSDVLLRRNFHEKNEIGSAQLNQLLSAVGKGAGDPKVAKAMQGILQNAAITMMSGNRVKKHQLRRMGVKGASLDVKRVALDYGRTAGGHLAKLTHMPAVRQALADMNEVIKNSDDKLNSQRSLIEIELRERFGDDAPPSALYPAWVKDIMTLSYLDKLASPAYSVINGMQPWMVTVPYLTGSFNPFRVVREMGRSYGTIAGHRVIGEGVANTINGVQLADIQIDTRDIVGSIKKNVLKADDGAFLSKVLEYADSRTPLMSAGMELAAAIRSGRNFWGTGLAGVDRMFRQLPMAVEAMNRSATLVTAARLARTTMSEDAAIKYAFDVMQNTQGDYSTTNQARLFNKPYLGLALQFKRYAQMMSHLLYDMGKRALSPDSTSAERMAALRQAAALVTVQIGMAGALGLPGLELVKLAAILAAAFGIGEGYDELERQMEDAAKQALGASWGEMVMKGVIPRAMGMDLSTRLSLADMWTFGEPKSNDREGTMAYVGALIGGAPVSLMMDWGSSFVDASNGDWGKAAEKIVPNKFISDTIKSVRGYADPSVNIPLKDFEVPIQAAGFRTARMANKGEDIGRAVATRKSLESDKKELQSAWLNATTKAQQLKVQVRIAEHNKRADQAKKPMLKVYTRGLDRIKTERKNERDRLQAR